MFDRALPLNSFGFSNLFQGIPPFCDFTIREPLYFFKFLFCTATQTNHTSECLNFQKKLIDTITTCNFYLEFKENNKNDMTFCYFSCLGWYCFRPMSMAALQLLMLTRWLSGLILSCWKNHLSRANLSSLPSFPAFQHTIR